jgi:hypothetical protein
MVNGVKHLRDVKCHHNCAAGWLVLVEPNGNVGHDWEEYGGSTVLSLIA